MRRHSSSWLACCVLIATLLIVVAMTSPQSAETAQPEPGVHVLATATDHVLLELIPGEISLDRVNYGDAEYTAIAIDGMQQTIEPGRPQVPTQGVMLGVPTDEGVTASVVSAETELLGRYAVVPAPDFIPTTPGARGPEQAGGLQPEFALDDALYATNAFYPAQRVSTPETGYLRDQAFAQVQFYPVRVNPVTGDVELTTRLVVQLSWDSTKTAEPAATTQPEFEAVLAGSLLNYESLNRPKATTRTAQTPVLTAEAGSPEQLNVRIRESGMYQVTYSDFVNAGITPSSIDPRQIKVHQGGTQQAVTMTGQADGVFNTGDKLIFYGEAYEDTYTNRNTYVVSWGGSNGQRMSTRSSAPGGATVPTQFRTTTTFEENTTYWWTMPDGHDRDHWFWHDRVAFAVSGLPASRDYTVTLPAALQSGSSATLRVVLEGYTSRPTTSPDHGSAIRVNGALVDSQTWDGYGSFEHYVTTPLNPGANTITVEATDPGSGTHQFYVNYIEVTFDTGYTAAGDRLAFSPPATGGTVRFEVNGFSSNSVAAYDVTDPARPVRITNGTVTASGGGYELAFQNTTTAANRYEATATNAYRTPDAIVPDQPSNWRSTAVGADYIIISPTYLLDEVAPLAAQRSADNLRVAVIELQDVYDEFNHGIENPQAIRDLLAYAYSNWVEPAPLYVLMAGDATYDYKNNLGATVFREMVPTQIIEADDVINNEGQAPSDNWFVTVSGTDILPDLFIGRIPLGPETVFTRHVDRILDYQQSPPASSWNTHAVYVADDDPLGTFADNSEDVISHLPPGYTVDRVFADNYVSGSDTADDIRADITQQINDGAVMVHYTGHGNVNRWGSWDTGNFYQATDIPALSNNDRYPFVTIGDCLNGYFVSADTRSMAEAFVYEPDKGAVAVWAPSWLGYSNGHTLITEFLYDALFQEHLRFLGEATSAAKYDVFAASAAWSEMVETYILFGDPYTTLGIEDLPPTVTSTTPANGATNVPVDTALRVAFDRQMAIDTVSFSSSPTVSFTPQWSEDGKSVVLNHNGLPHGASMTVTVTGEDRYGSTLQSASSSWSFTVSSDATAPSVTLQVGNGSTTNVPLDANIRLTFSETVREESVVFSIDPPADGYLNWLTTGRIAEFVHPGRQFTTNTQYTFSVTAARDLAGNALPSAETVVFTTSATDNAPPTLTAFEVEGGSTFNVPVTAKIIMSFNEEMNTGSLSTSIVPSVAGAITWNATRTTATFEPDPAYDELQSYTFTLNSAADVAGNALDGAPHELSFTTSFDNTDTTPPTASFSVSGGNIFATPLDATLKFTFSEPMNQLSVGVLLSPDSAGTPTLVWGSDTSLQVTYPTDFSPGQAYSIAVAGADIAGNPLASPTNFDFVAAGDDGLAPTATISVAGDPPLNAVPTSSQLLVTFSEPMNIGTVATVLTPSVPVASAWNLARTVLTITPLPELDAGVQYTLRVNAGAEDVAGNPMASPVSLTFTAQNATLFLPLVVR